MFGRINAAFGAALAHYLLKPVPGYSGFAVSSPARLAEELRPGDVLLVEGDLRISSAIKYLTRSTWSHAAFAICEGPGAELIEADLEEGVQQVGLDAYAHLNTRICRPVGLRPDDLDRLVRYMRNSIGRRYDLKNVFDLARYLLPIPPVPRRFHRRMLALGSGDPTRAICSTLIAEAFQSVCYPVLPDVTWDGSGPSAREILHIRNYSLFTPRDFDVSPFFEVIKPSLPSGFDYRSMAWAGASTATAPQFLDLSPDAK